MTKVVAIVSGGLDSTTLVYQLHRDGLEVDCVSFNYGQRHKKELVYAIATAKQLGLKHDIVDLSGLTHLISNSALTTQETADGDNVRYYREDEKVERKIEVPEGHYAEETMKATVVPNRNMIMLSVAAGIAINRGAEGLAIGVHAGDHFIYPDCRPSFIAHANAAIVKGNEGFGPIREHKEGSELHRYILAPYLGISKADIAYRALELNVPLHMTWSCYRGGTNHCGRCGTCVERLEAIDEAIRRVISEGSASSEMWTEDMTVYDDNEYWKTVTKTKEA